MDEAVGLVQDGNTLTISCSSGLNVADRTLAALGKRFVDTGSPGSLTLVFPIAVGDMFGQSGLDHLAHPGMVRCMIGGSYPSGPSSMPPPKMIERIYSNKVEAYNFPSGVLMHLHREIAGKRPGVLTEIGLGTFVDPRIEGGRMNAITREDLVKVVEFQGKEWLFYPSFPLDVAIVRGTTADEDGNISMEHEGAYLGSVVQALAVHNCGGKVIVQVKRVAERGTLNPQHVRIPGAWVDAVVVDPEQQQATQTLYDSSISGETRRPWSSFEPVPFDVFKVIARRAALELSKGDLANLGFGVSALLPRVLLEEGVFHEVTFAIEQGATGGMPLGEFQFGCAANAQAIVESPLQFDFLQGAGFDVAFLSFLEVDMHGSVNVSRLRARPHVTAGAGGFIDITQHARRLVFSGFFTAGGQQLEIENGKLHILQEGKHRKFVSSVEHLTLDGRRARQAGKQILYITERGVFRLTEQGPMLVEIAPGVDVKSQILDLADFPIPVSADLKEMDLKLFRPAPLNLELPPKRENNCGH
ncbi:MAG TPA: CoA-transferase [Acidobacteriota bacterium]|nr:CoA-transferase [Acidobacteriota bacterium]